MQRVLSISMNMRNVRVVRFLYLLLIANKCNVNCNEGNSVDVWNDVFNERSDKEWKNVWHSEKHRRCYQDLESHMKWVCLKDIYKIRTRRNGHVTEIPDSADTGIDKPWMDAIIPKNKAFDMFTGKSRRKRRGIMDECCVATTGCSWEEYAEYCTHNNRVRL